MKESHKRNNLKKQHGFGVVSALLSLIIISLLLLSFYQYSQWLGLQSNAKTLGNKIAMVVNATQNRLSFDENFVDGNYDLNALLDSSCGGNAHSKYLPCGFSLKNNLNDGKITIAVTTSTTNNQIRLANITSSIIGISDRSNPLAVKPMAALAGRALGAAESEQVFAGNKYLSATASYSLDRKKSIITAHIIANQNNSNIYLRVDGSNKMENALSFNENLNADKRMVKYVSKISNDNDLRIQESNNLYLGNQSGVKRDSNVIVNDLTIHSMADQKLTDLLVSVPVGSIFPYAGNIAPLGFFECDGRTYNTSTFPKLYQALGSTKIPDLRGQFVRGWDHGAGVDTGRVLGSAQGDAIQNIKGTFGNYSTTGPTASGVFSVVKVGANSYARGNSLLSVRATFDASKVVRTANENRPKNIALMYIIKHD